jgi:hypothetical protein
MRTRTPPALPLSLIRQADDTGLSPEKQTGAASPNH